MTDPSNGQYILDKLGGRLKTTNQQSISGAGAGDIEKMTLCFIDLFEIRLIGHGFDSLPDWPGLSAGRRP